MTRFLLSIWSPLLLRHVPLETTIVLPIHFHCLLYASHHERRYRQEADSPPADATTFTLALFRAFAGKLANRVKWRVSYHTRFDTCLAASISGLRVVFHFTGGGILIISRYSEYL